MNKFLNFSLVILLVLCGISPLNAQMFTREATSKTDAVQTRAEKKSSETEIKNTDIQNLDMTEDEEKEVMRRLKEQLNPRVEDGNLVINPVNLGKTSDGSQRGTAAFISADEGEDADDGNIFLYYSNFKISRTAATGLGCRVRFHILNGLNSRVSNVSIKLVWPGINTPLSFNNVNPNTENYFDYALFGDGCYQMDKIPNIVVNRCRVKGMSQEACANRIRWLTKQ